MYHYYPYIKYINAIYVICTSLTSERWGSYLAYNSVFTYNADGNIWSVTGKSLSEALIFASTNPQYDNRLFIELPVQYMKIPSSEHWENMGRTCCAHKLF